MQLVIYVVVGWVDMRLSALSFLNLCVSSRPAAMVVHPHPHTLMERLVLLNARIQSLIELSDAVVDEMEELEIDLASFVLAGRTQRLQERREQKGKGKGKGKDKGKGDGKDKGKGQGKDKGKSDDSVPY